jgi:hypothetical protein
VAQSPLAGRVCVATERCEVGGKGWGVRWSGGGKGGRRGGGWSSASVAVKVETPRPAAIFRGVAIAGHATSCLV